MTSRVLTRHKCCAAWRTDGTVDVELREQGALLRETIEMRCLDVRMAVATQVAPPKVVRENENDVWLFGGGTQRRAEREGKQQSRNNLFHWGSPFIVMRTIRQFRQLFPVAT